MKKSLLAMAMVFVMALPGWAAKKKKAKGGGAKALPAGAWKKKAGLYAKFQTSNGDFVCELYEKEAPETVASFKGLAVGDREFLDAKDNETKKGRFYDGLTVHRVVPDYIIQGGDPKGDSTGGPGWQFDDEINGLKFDRPGRLAIANSGANTNGSQFFITIPAVAQLDDKKDADGNIMSHYTIFGQVVDGQKVVEAISRVKADGEKPVVPVVIKKLDILRVNKKRRLSTVQAGQEAPPKAAEPKEGAEPDVSADESAPAEVKPAAAPKQVKKGKKRRGKKKAAPVPAEDQPQ